MDHPTQIRSHEHQRQTICHVHPYSKIKRTNDRIGLQIKLAWQITSRGQIHVTAMHLLDGQKL